MLFNGVSLPQKYGEALIPGCGPTESEGPVRGRIGYSSSGQVSEVVRSWMPEAKPEYFQLFIHGTGVVLNWLMFQ